MPDVHTIRLRGPWELTPLSETGATGMLPGENPQGFAGGTIMQQLPAAWDDVLPAFRGTVRYMRRFGKPTNLEPRERVWLCLEAAAGSVAVQLNGAPLATPRADVTELLRERNLLLIEVTQLDSKQPAGLVGEVRLEIRVADSLRESEPV